MVAPPGPVVALDLSEAHAHLLVEGSELGAAHRGLRLGRHHVGDVLFAAVGPESAHQPLVRELAADALGDRLRLVLHVAAPFG